MFILHLSWAKIIKNVKLPIFMFIITALMLVLIYAILGIVPFGEQSVLATDLKNQYVSYFAYFKSIFEGTDSIIYSFSKTLSGNMIGLFGYYLISPFNFLLLLFDVSNFPLALSIVTILKTSAIALTMSGYLIFKKVPNLPNILLSMTYAFSGYVVAYQQNIMWLDVLILLPLVIMGIDIIVEKGSFYWYTIFLALTIIVNYYLGFMVCIFSVIYFVATNLGSLLDSNFKMKNYLKRVLDFMLGSLLAGGISSIIWLPALASYSGSSKVEFTLNEIITKETTFSLTDLMSKFIIGSTNSQQIRNGLPNIFITISLLTLGLLFFMNKKISKGTKVKYSSMILVMLCSFYYLGLNRIWHGFSDPTWFPYRNSFIFIFILLILIGEQVKYMEVTIPNIIIVGLLGGLGIWYIYQQDYSYISNTNLLLTSLILITVIILLILLSLKYMTINLFFTILLLITLGEISYNYIYSYKSLIYYEAPPFTAFVDKNQTIMEKYKPSNEDFYRLDMTNNYNENSPLLLNYPGLSHYSSNESDKVKTFLGNLGYRNNGNWSIYANGSSEFSDSLLGVKYTITDKERNVPEKIENKNDLNIYHNKNYFPLAFEISQKSDDNILNFDNTFEYQNMIAQTFFDYESNLYEKVDAADVEFELVNLSEITESSMTEFEVVDESKEAYVIMQVKNFDMNSDLNLYFNNKSPGNKRVGVYFDNQYFGEVSSTKNNSILTYRPSDTQIEIKLKVLNEKIDLQNLLLYANDSNTMTQLANIANNRGIEINSISGDKISGNIPQLTNKSNFVFTIPYDESWLVEVDGKRVNTYPVVETLLGVEIPQNSKKITLRYVPNGLILGITISLLSIILMVIYFIVYNRLKHNHVHNKVDLIN